ncbi:MAG: FAD-dependent oxidoreductase [Ruminococcus sp.]|nr:FAD-dependent oxidoreductase [Ruminococcus sp.]MDY3895841.1 FAD-dependent oxidoreductase [Candidatus Fimenecus sp.]
MSILKKDVLIIGAGPSGIFTALEMLKNGSKKKIMIVEKGLPVEKRHCPKAKTGKCVNCKPDCNITTGFSGAGAFSDGKLSLSCEVGGNLPDLIGHEFAQQMIEYTDKIYLSFGADKKVEGVGHDEKVKAIRLRAIQAGLKLVDCPIRHLGTEMAQELYGKIEKYLTDNGVEIVFKTECVDLIVEDGRAKGAVFLPCGKPESEKFTVSADNVVIATGRKGADWLEDMCKKHNIEHLPGTVDIGVRVEVRNEVMEDVNEALYESKLIGYPEPFTNKVRTFCQNPGGFVSQENYDNNSLAVVNGHSYKNTKSDNTNLAILCSHNFRPPFDEPIPYAKKVGELVNMLADGHILVQRYGDILAGKRTWQEDLARSNVRPTLPDAVAGDLTAAMPYRTLMNIIKFIEAVDKVVPGFASEETLLYGPEIKFYSNKVKMDKKFNTNIEGLHCLGDSSGWTRGLMMASVMGVLMGRELI